jgi:transcriptional regulator GlxA family with amidase domain
MEMTTMDTMSISPNGASLPTTGPSLALAVLEMLGRADRAIDIDPRSARVFIGQASRLLEPASEATATAAAFPGLAPWQEREVIRHIGDHLDQTIHNGDLAKIAGLSVGHFSRRFKGSFGVSPRVYVIRSRLERAKTLMRLTGSSLCQIALESGFADQAHMSRLFLAIVGSTPTRWRRGQASGG